MRAFLVFLVSLLGHAGLVVAGLLYFPESTRQFATSQIVPLELITEIQEITNLPEEEVEEEPVLEEAPPEPEPEETPPPPDPEPEVELDAEPDVAPVDEAEPEATPAPSETAQPEEETPQRPVRSRREDSLDSLLADLASTVEEERGSSSSRDDRPAQASYEALGITLADSIRSQAQRCYRSSVDAPNPEQLIVLVRVRLNRDGTLDGQPDVLNRDTIEGSGNRFWRVARDRSVAAIIDCAPYRLPAEYFSIWRRIDVTFRSDN
ncbi:hypothetical protein [Hyphobacterium sp.]|uniref:hypothetical protein n=1 Tax=Hyphobacterium sp. TaxID=2004662 RepID=UPI003BA8FF05